jgi:hypothetical protein
MRKCLLSSCGSAVHRHGTDTQFFDAFLVYTHAKLFDVLT